MISGISYYLEKDALVNVGLLIAEEGSINSDFNLLPSLDNVEDLAVAALPKASCSTLVCPPEGFIDYQRNLT